MKGITYFIKIFLSIIALLLIPSFLYASGLGVTYVGSGVGYDDLYLQDFNATTEPSPPTGWLEQHAAVNWDSSAAPTDMEGAQEVEIQPVTGTNITYVFGDMSTYYCTFHFQVDDPIDSDEDVIRIYGNGGSDLLVNCRVDLPTPGIHCTAIGGTVSSETTTVIAEDTIYKIKMKYVHIGAANNSVELWFWDGDSWEDHISSTDGNVDYDADRIRFINGCDTEKLYIDYYQQSSSDISSPDP